MSRLTQSQREKMLDAQAALERGEIVVLKGRNNGKTRIAHELQEAIATRQPDGSIRTERRHAENSQVEFLSGVHWARSDKMTEVSIFRQVLAHSGEKVPVYPHQVVMRAKVLLRELKKEGRVLCIAVDNAETLCARAFSVMKGLNELRDDRRNVGIAFLVAGLYGNGKTNAPPSFYKHATEVRIGKIAPAEIADIIESHFPSESIRFDEKALNKLASLETTLDVHSSARKAIMLRKDLRKSTVTLPLLEEALV